jgi:putative ABC transport system permease protein
MFKNYLTVALRNFLRERFYSVLNVTGLATGLCCALLILLWVKDELSVNRFHKDIDRIFLVYGNYLNPSGEIVTWNDTPGLLGEYVRENISGVESVARTFPNRQRLFQVDDKNIISDGLYADHEFFDIFSFKILAGGLSKNREDKSQMMISESLAKKLFNTADVVGKSFKMDALDVQVAGVFEDVSTASSIKFDFVAPLQIYKEWRGQGYNWGDFDLKMYLKLQDGKVSSVTNAINEKWIQVMKELNEDDHFEYSVLPFADSYLHGEFKNGVPAGGKIVYVQIFTVVAIFILVIACVNFMNMATARALHRSKEIGIRKVAGAARKSLILQFIGEALFTSTIAMVFAIGTAYIILPGFNVMLEKQIHLELTDPFTLLSIIAMIFISGILAGSYPAFILSSFSPKAALKGSYSSGGQGNGLRHALVVFQFVLAIVLIICSIATFRQIKYMLNKDLGYDRHSIISFNSSPIRKNYEAFREEVVGHDGVIDITRANSSLINVTNHSNGVEWPGKERDEQLFRVIVVDYNFAETMKLQLLAGRHFSLDFHDENNFIITKASAAIMGFDNPVGQKISVWDQEGVIVGIVDDFHSQSLKGAIEPAILFCRPEQTGLAFVRFDATKTSETIKSLETSFKKYNADFPFTYRFMDEEFETMYKTESTAGTLAIGFTVMAIIISSLGLLGLTTYSTQRRRKEIGIRKTLGASLSRLVTKISAEFVRLGLIAFVIACPVAWFAMNKFMQTYAYHTDLDWTVFAFTGILSISLTTFIVVYQVLKAATLNPVDVLRNE